MMSHDLPRFSTVSHDIPHPPTFSHALQVVSKFQLPPPQPPPPPSAVTVAFETVAGAAEGAMAAAPRAALERLRRELAHGCHLSDAAADGARLEFVDEFLCFEGAPVTFTGLVRGAELNGQPAVVCGCRPERSDGQVRYPVKPAEARKPILAQLINLRVRPP